MSFLSLKTKSKLRILDFDIECRPISFLGSDFTTSEVTAIAASYMDETKVHVWLLGRETLEEILLNFKAMYDQADIVTGHYIRNFDLPQVQGALMEYQLPALGPKLTSCTKNDLIKRRGISASQENLSQMFNLSLDKTHMSQIDWREANRLSDEGIKKTERRVSTDVQQHKLLRTKLLELNLLSAPKVWKP